MYKYELIFTRVYLDFIPFLVCQQLRIYQSVGHYRRFSLDQMRVGDGWSRGLFRSTNGFHELDVAIRTIIVVVNDDALTSRTDDV